MKTMYAIQVPPASRDTLQDHLNESGIMTGIHYPNPIHKTKAFNYIKGSYPVSEEVSTKILSLPMYPGLQPKQLKEIVKLIKTNLK
jgi:dTDP-4-amino-4,6-dideoxygalactose transaminase